MRRQTWYIVVGIALTIFVAGGLLKGLVDTVQISSEPEVATEKPPERERMFHPVTQTEDTILDDVSEQFFDVTGVLIDDQGSFVANEQISLYSRRLAKIHKAISQADGYFKMADVLAASDYELTVRPVGRYQHAA